MGISKNMFKNLYSILEKANNRNNKSKNFLEWAVHSQMWRIKAKTKDDDVNIFVKIQTNKIIAEELKVIEDVNWEEMAITEPEHVKS